MFRANRSRHFRAAVPLYHFLFTTKGWEIAEYQRFGARSVRHVHDAVDEQRFQPRDPTSAERERFGAAVTFIGRCEPHYADTLRAVAESGLDLGVWGPRWTRHARRHAWARRCVRGDGVWLDDYPVALSCAGLALGLLSKNFPETTTTRTYEIPACGTFLLAERTEDHLSLYEEGREAEYFASPGELVEKARFYTANEAARERIARAGHERYLQSGYTRRARYREMLDAIQKG
jgi:spore maturation protein CgeB